MKHEVKTCPRCEIVFECKVGDIVNCQCNIEINEATRPFLLQTNFDCLCVNCLQHFNHLNIIAKRYQFPAQTEMFIEGLHFYKENEYWVFTELYHLLRGHCCKSGCRHCVYGFEKVI